MSTLTARERVRRTLQFQETDRAPCDLMESIVWPELQEWFAIHKGLSDPDDVRDFLDLDFRWFWPNPEPPDTIDFNDPMYSLPYTGDYSDRSVERPLREVRTVDEMLKKHAWPDPEWWDFKPVHDLRAKYPDKAIVLLVHWTMLFMNACDFFGMEEALVRLVEEDEVFVEFLRRQNEFALALFRRACEQGAAVADLAWCMDDVGTQRALLMQPELWRKYFKEPLRQQIAVMHEYGLKTIYHSCGAIRPLLPDLIEIGLDAFEPFQTTAEGMDAESIARDFGGRLVFYGGVDVQHLLTFGSEDDVRNEVRRNLDRFADVGGYVVSNSHHCIPAIKPENIIAMIDEARRPRPMKAGR